MTPYLIPLGNAEIDRERVVLPRTRGYQHRDIIAVVHGVGMTEEGELVKSLPIYAASSDPCIWITNDPAELLIIMDRGFPTLSAFNYQITSSQEAGDGVPVIRHDRLTRFGFNAPLDDHPKGCAGCIQCGGLPGRRRSQAMHTVWSPGEMTRNPARIVGGENHSALMTFARDIRAWCEEHNLPLPTSFGGIASALLRDPRFYPEPRGRVPRATNERVRPHLPGVYSELLAETHTAYHAVALDQRTAYHRAAQEVPMPDSTTLYARGYFDDPDNAPRVWAYPGDTLYERTVRQPGLLALLAELPKPRKRFVFLPPLLNRRRVVYLWSNELDTAQAQGMKVYGLVAAWTSRTVDEGMPLYGKWAQGEIERASEYRKRWLKPVLHMTYGLLAARSRDLRVGTRAGNGAPTKYILGRGHEFPVREAALGEHMPATTNVAALGVLQAEIRARSIRLANALMGQGVNVLHIHADGIHVEGALPLVSDEWRVEPRTRLTYLDRVSWMSEESDCLPGRTAESRAGLIRTGPEGGTYTPPGWADRLRGIRHRRALNQ